MSIILNKLVSNAFRYKDPNKLRSYIKAYAIVNPDSAIIVVEDNVIGITKEHHAKIFEMFYRVTDYKPGSGLGLYMVREAVQKLNGIIKVASDSGMGARFEM